MYSKVLQILFIVLLSSIHGFVLNAQTPLQMQDSVNVSNDTIPADTATLQDETRMNTLEDPVEYSAKDSVVYSLGRKMVYLYGEAKVNYQDIEVKAAHIEFDMEKNTMLAKGIEDSVGKVTGQPEFTQGSENFSASLLQYNFNTQKGLIREIFTEQEGGYLHSDKTKRHETGEIHLKGGKYTTCDRPHPHYYITLTKAKNIPGDKIVSGPAYIVLEDVPLPIGIPFGFFPNKRTSTSGILMPQYGEEKRRGFYLRNGGYYLALNDYMDLRLTSDIYTNGTFGFRLGSSYRVRYRFGGNLNFRYYNNVTGEKGLPGYQKSKDFAVMWSHSQAAEANPNSSFTANVNFTSMSYDRNHSRNLNNALTNTKQSSISYNKVWPNSPFSFSGSFNHSQNSLNKTVSLKIPGANFSMNRIYPLRKKNRSGRARWYENLQVSYSSTLDNNLETTEEKLFSSTGPEDFDAGYRHNIPVSMNLKASKHLTISPNVRYTGVLFTRSIKKSWQEDKLVVDTIPGIRYAHAYVPSLNIVFNPKIYGMFRFRKGSGIEAIRHVMTPSVSFGYVPDMAGKVPDYYDEVQIDTTGRTRAYSIFDESVYRLPVAYGRSGTVNFSLRNNVEMKIKTPGDTIEGVKKVKLLDNLNFSTNYNIFLDSMNWAPVRMSGNTSFLDRKINLRFNSRFDPYAYAKDQSGRFSRINRPEFSSSGKPFRLTNFTASVSMNFSSGSAGGSMDAREEPGLREEPGSRDANDYSNYNDEYYGEYVDFNVPWTFGLAYNFSYNKPYEETEIVQTIRINGDISLTPKWKIGLNTGYDFQRNEFTPTNLSVYRDLHCWEMRISVVPFGYYRSYNFQINIKSSILRDIKYEKGEHWYDNF